MRIAARMGVPGQDLTGIPFFQLGSTSTELPTALLEFQQESEASRPFAAPTRTAPTQAQGKSEMVLSADPKALFPLWRSVA
jgi:hypothetical protein